MKVQILVSTMNLNDAHLLYDKMNIKSDSIIINQCEQEGKKRYDIKGKILEVNSYKEKGLSKSRNRALENANAEICVISDDDVKFIDYADKIISKAFEQNPNYDIIAFQVEGIDQVFKKYPLKAKTIGYISSMKIASVEIAFRLSSIREKEIKFNELFGSGAKYNMGEENIFLYECLRRGLKIKYVPTKIADLYVGDSSWFKGYTDKYFIDKGAAFTAMSKKCSLFLIIQFVIRKYLLYKSEKSLLDALMLMIKGRRLYKSENINEIK